MANKYTDEELIQSLKDFYIEHDRAPKGTECKKINKLHSLGTYKSRFGGWTQAKKVAGITIGKGISKVELVNSLQAFYSINGRIPKQSECTNDNGLFGVNTYKNSLGSWDEILAIVKNTSIPSTIITEEELIKSLQDYYKEYGKSPTVYDCSKCSYLKGKGTYTNRFGSFTRALMAAGLSANKRVSKVLTDEELLQTIKDFYIEESRAPKHRDCKEHKYLASHTTYSRRFDTFTNAIDLAGVPQNKDNLVISHITEEELLETIKRFFKEYGRVPNVSDCKNTDYLKSYTTYGNRLGTFKKAIELANISNIKNSDRDLLVSNLKRFYKEHKRQPSQKEYETCAYLAGWGTYYDKLGSVHAALEEAGIPIIAGTSILELQLQEFIKTLYLGEILLNDRKILQGKELDIVLPELKLAIEFNGLYWHSESKGKDKNYHLNKTIEAEKAGYRLIHIFEHEWENKRSIVESRLNNSLGNSKTLYARKCEIREVTSKDSKEFLELNHIQGNAAGSIRLGLYYENELVAIQTFCKSRFSTKTEWELLRYCNKLNTSIVGGASRLFKHFIKTYTPESIVSYSDIRWNTGDLYNKLGFEYSHSSTPNYWYFKGLKVESRVKYQKHKLEKLLKSFDSSKTEQENMLDNGFKRIFDCGNRVYIWHKHQKNNS